MTATAHKLIIIAAWNTSPYRIDYALCIGQTQWCFSTQKGCLNWLLCWFTSDSSLRLAIVRFTLLLSLFVAPLSRLEITLNYLGYSESTSILLYSLLVRPEWNNTMGLVKWNVMYFVNFSGVLPCVSWLRYSSLDN